MKIKIYRKILSALIPVLLAGVEELFNAIEAGSDGGRKITSEEWGLIAAAMWSELQVRGWAAPD